MAASGRVAFVSALALLSGCEHFESSSRSAQQALWASPLNDKRYTRALDSDKDGVLGASKRVNDDAPTKRFQFEESDGTVDQIGVFRPKPDLLEPSF